MTKKLCLVAGARPNFSKIAPLIRAIKNRDDALAYSLVHTGQHYDSQMSDVFFADLGIPAPNISLNCGGGTHATQTARIMTAFESAMEQDRPDWVVVVGDVNSTLACSIVAKKLKINVAHIEAGLRSGDRDMPEEINRMVTDSISDLFFTTEPDGQSNLLKEGHTPDKIHFVGNLMIDNLYYQLERIDSIAAHDLDPENLKERLLSATGRFGAVTLHRPSNVDVPEKLTELMQALNHLAERIPLVFPAHPRTRNALNELGLTVHQNIHMTEPLSYMRFLHLWKDAAVVVTDSGGLQEETTALGIPCVTARESTERPITLTEGSNKLAGANGEIVLRLALAAIEENRSDLRPALWDGQAADRIADLFAKL